MHSPFNQSIKWAPSGRRLNKSRRTSASISIVYSSRNAEHENKVRKFSLSRFFYFGGINFRRPSLRTIREARILQCLCQLKRQIVSTIVLWIFNNLLFESHVCKISVRRRAMVRECDQLVYAWITETKYEMNYLLLNNKVVAKMEIVRVRYRLPS